MSSRLASERRAAGQATWPQVASLLVTAAFALVMYTFLHELGHALAGVTFGGRVIEFSIYFFDLNAPHVSIAGEFSPWQNAVKAAAGAALPVLVCAVFLLLTPRKANETMERLKLIGTVSAAGSLTAWVVIALLELVGQGPASDDVVNFLDSSGLHPLLTAIGAAAVIASLVRLYLARITSFRDVLQLNRARTPLSPGGQRSMVALVGLLSAGLLLAWAGGALQPRAGGVSAQASPPASYQLAAELDLGGGTFTDKTVAVFNVGQPVDGGVYLFLRNTRTETFQMTLHGPEDFRQEIFHADGYSSSSDSALFEALLEPGEYRLALDSTGSQGRIWIYTLGPVVE